MVPVALSDVIAVGEVPTAAEIEILAQAGFRSLLNTQPDGEIERFATAADVADLATQAGLAYCHVPVTSRRPDEPTLAAFAAALDDLPRPIYACCYSGARTAAAWALVAAERTDTLSVEAACKAAGFDVSFLRDALAARWNAGQVAAAAPAATNAAAPAATTEAAAPAPGSDAATSLATTGHPVATTPESPAVPQLKPFVLMPRAATGGCVVAG